jgi:hypothetical protein
MNWNFATILMQTVSVALTGSLLAGAIYFAGWKRNQRFGIPAAFVFFILAVASVFANPITNILFSFEIADHRIARLESKFLNQPVERLHIELGPPRHTWTNELGAFFSYDGLTPVFAMYRERTLILASNSIVTRIWADD